MGKEEGARGEAKTKGRSKQKSEGAKSNSN